MSSTLNSWGPDVAGCPMRVQIGSTSVCLIDREVGDGFLRFFSERPLGNAFGTGLWVFPGWHSSLLALRLPQGAPAGGL